jgi:predicted porin
MKNIFIIIFFSNTIFSQEAEEFVVNPRNNWFFGIEIGNNKITSFSFNEPKNYFQVGLLAEYYFAKHWSATARVKYFKTGLSFIKSASYGTFKGAVISVPLNIKWEYRIVKNFSGNFKLGIALNNEVESNYDYSQNSKSDYDKSFTSFNSGLGFNYFLNKKMSIYGEYESYIWGNDRDESDFLEIEPNSTNNNLINFGIKYNFK